jgi:hypothetical protein
VGDSIYVWKEGEVSPTIEDRKMSGAPPVRPQMPPTVPADISDIIPTDIVPHLAQWQGQPFADMYSTLSEEDDFTRSIQEEFEEGVTNMSPDTVEFVWPSHNNVSMSQLNWIAQYLIRQAWTMFSQTRVDAETVYKVIVAGCLTFYLSGFSGRIRTTLRDTLRDAPVLIGRKLTVKEKEEWAIETAKRWGIPPKFFDNPAKRGRFLDARVEGMVVSAYQTHILKNGWMHMKKHSGFTRPFTDGSKHGHCGIHIKFLLILKMFSATSTSLTPLEMTYRQWLTHRGELPSDEDE